MRKIRKLDNTKILQIGIIAILFSFLFFSCSPVKYIPDDEYLLDRYRIKVEEGKVKKEELKDYIRQKPNKRILGLRFHLGMYNLSNKNKEKGISNWLRTIGEEPVIFDEFLANKSTEQLKSYLNNKGFYNSVVKDTIQFKRKRARVLYKVEVNEPYTIKDISYLCNDSALVPIVMPDTLNSLIKVGENFDRDILQNERERIEVRLKNKGYYRFSKDFISFQADSSNRNKKVALELIVKNYPKRDFNNNIVLSNHKKYKIRNLYVFTNYNQKEALNQAEFYYDNVDTTFIDGIYFISKGEDNLGKRVIFQSNFIEPGQYYSLDDANKTYRHLNSLRLFKIINIQFKEVQNTENDTSSVGYLDCNIELTKYYMQSYTVELQGTNSYGNIGLGGNILYQHRSLFGGAEITDFRINGSIETIDKQSFGGNDYTTELGADITVSIPQFLLPVFKAERFSKKYSPKTQISVGYNFQDRIEYRRSIANLSYGYNWDGNRYLKHRIGLIELNAVNVIATPSFKNYIDSTYLKSSYENHIVSVSNYTLIFNNQDIKKNNDFYFFRMNSEFSGNILSAYSELTNATKVDGSYQLFGIPFSQYIKVDFDFRYYDIVDKSSTIAYRLFAGIGIPYGNSVSLPFEKMYFSGGANSVRAWTVRDLGPGSYSGGSLTRFPNQTGDIKLEANLEYRFKLFWVLEGAFFIDAGNVWSLQSDEFEGGLFRKDQFYKEFAIGSGFGTRFDFSFFIFRLDLGVKLRDPALPDGQRWIIGNRRLNWTDDFTVNIGIGYPF